MANCARARQSVQSKTWRVARSDLRTWIYDQIVQRTEAVLAWYGSVGPIASLRHILGDSERPRLFDLGIFVRSTGSRCSPSLGRRWLRPSPTLRQCAPCRGLRVRYRRPGLARLHDLWHSHGVMNGEDVPFARRMPGLRRAASTNRNVHLDDATQSEAADRVAVAIRCETWNDTSISRPKAQTISSEKERKERKGPDPLNVC